MKKANCIMTMMEKLRDLYKEINTKTPVSNDKTPVSNDKQAKDKNQTINQSQKGKPCLFNLNCPAARCPFRTGKAANEFVNNLIDINSPGSTISPKNRLKKCEIVDDADLFVVNVGRVDPCRVIAPLVYKDGWSQCFETDFSTISSPPTVIEEGQKKGKKSKKANKSKKSKKAKA